MALERMNRLPFTKKLSGGSITRSFFERSQMENGVERKVVFNIPEEDLHIYRTFGRLFKNNPNNK